MENRQEIDFDERLYSLFVNKKILILGFGKEGRSSFHFLSTLSIPLSIAISDAYAGNRDEVEKIVGKDVKCILGDSYLNTIEEYDLIIKAPGIPLSTLEGKVDMGKVSSQTNLFVEVFRTLIIGITGTKGKSTTSTLIYNLLQQKYEDVLLVGNIGKPAFDYINQITKNTIIVFEMSSHQLELLGASPHISLLLNLYEEHLDHYANLRAYHDAKWNIAKFQLEGDLLLYNKDDVNLQKRVEKCKSKALKLPIYLDNSEIYSSLLGKISNRILLGDHNKMNILFLLDIAKRFEIKDNIIINVLNSYEGLPHRLQFFGDFKGISFYDDSISTIPEATMLAINALVNVQTLILGGKDRGINYDSLPFFLEGSSVQVIILVGETSQRMGKLMTPLKTKKKIFKVDSYDKIAKIVFDNTNEGKICLLSPAASSYDMFANFEERGEYFQKIITDYVELL